VLLGDDVFDLAAKERVCLVNEAVLAQPVGPRLDEPPKCRRE
jgi:hypothetical protein